MTKFILIICLLIIALLFTCVGRKHEPTYYDVIRNKEKIPLTKVLIKQSVSKVSITIDDKFLVLNQYGEPILDVTTGISNGRIGYDKDSAELYIEGSGKRDSLGVNYCKIQIPSGGLASIDKGKYLGSIIIYANSKDKLNVVNELDLETYLLGVLSGETMSSFGLEAIKTQAVASRSYALSEMLKRQGKRWHLKSTTQSQVYKGLVRVHSKFEKAVNETRGLVLIDNEKVIRAYFSSNCGGATASLDSLSWEKQAGTVMLARECPWCKKMKPRHFFWEAKFSIKEISFALKRKGYRFKKLKSIAIKQKDKFSRVIQLEMKCSDRKFVVDANLFRTTILKSTGKLRSRMFVMKKVGSKYSFKGRGWGHGVGMCQYGSQGLAKEGWGFRRILGYYYLGAKISKRYE